MVRTILRAVRSFAFDGYKHPDSCKYSTAFPTVGRSHSTCVTRVTNWRSDVREKVFSACSKASMLLRPFHKRAKCAVCEGYIDDDSQTQDHRGKLFHNGCARLSYIEKSNVHGLDRKQRCSS